MALNTKETRAAQAAKTQCMQHLTQRELIKL